MKTTSNANGTQGAPTTQEAQSVDNVTLNDAMDNIEALNDSMKNFTSPLIDELNIFQANSEERARLKESNESIVKSVTRTINNAVTALKGGSTSRKTLVAMLFTQIEAGVAVDTEVTSDYVGSIVRVLKWYFTSKMTLKKELVSFANIKALRGVRAYITARSVNDAMKLSGADYKKAIDKIINSGKELKGLVTTINTYSEAERAKVVEGCKIAKLKSGKIKLEASMLSDIKEVHNFQSIAGNVIRDHQLIEANRFITEASQEVKAPKALTA